MRTVSCSVVALSLLAACGSYADDDERSVRELGDRAAQITDLLGENDWSAVREDFDETMTEELPEELLRTAWEQVVDAKGAYRSRGEPARIPKPGDLVVFDTPMTFENGEMKSRVTFHPDGRIAGLFILEPQAA